jgi:outer membrane protein assembly factor BamB
MKKAVLYLIIVLALICSPLLYAETSWPNWRGPEFTGVAPGCNPPTVWSETQNIKWKVKLTGDGSDGSPIVWKDKIFFQTAVKTDKPVAVAVPADLPLITTAEMASPPPPPGGQRRGGNRGNQAPTNIYQFNLVCMDRATGKVLWEKTACEAAPHQGHHGDHGYASFSPVTDGKYVWASFGSQGMYCFDVDGKLIWKQDLVKMKTRFGEGNSPAIAGDAVIVVADNETESWIWAFNKTTGETIWKKQRDETTTHATPLVLTVAGKMQVIVSATNKIRAYDAKTGDVIWECGGMTGNVIPTPVADSEMVYCTSGFRGSMLQAIKLGRTGDLTGTDAVVWQVKEATPYVPSPILYDGKIYVFSVNDAILSCYDAKTGKPFYVKQKLDEMKNIYAAPVGANGNVYCAGRNGVTYVLKNADAYEVVSINKLDDGLDATPAIVDNEIFLKGKQYMYCIAEKK